jgi:hypothetical protein
MTFPESRPRRGTPEASREALRDVREAADLAVPARGQLVACAATGGGRQALWFSPSAENGC